AFDAQALSVSAVGYYSLPLVDLFGRVGVARWKSDRDAGFFGDTERGTDLTYGVGAQLRFLSLALRLEYERFKIDSDSIDTVSLGLTYTFFCRRPRCPADATVDSRRSSPAVRRACVPLGTVPYERTSSSDRATNTNLGA